MLLLEWMQRPFLRLIGKKCHAPIDIFSVSALQELLDALKRLLASAKCNFYFSLYNSSLSNNVKVRPRSLASASIVNNPDDSPFTYIQWFAKSYNQSFNRWITQSLDHLPSIIELLVGPLQEPKSLVSMTCEVEKTKSRHFWGLHLNKWPIKHSRSRGNAGNLASSARTATAMSN